jgi:predicted Zn finger-like uncharacterized protein
MFEALRIPLPIGPLLVYMTAKYVEQAPPAPSEPEKSFWRLKCPHCAAVYTYDEEKGIEHGTVKCQNCSREFGPTVDKQASEANSEEDVQ